MKLRIDFETRSRCNLKDHGLYVYAEDPTTDVFCCAVKCDGENRGIWIGPKFKHWLDKIDHGLTLISDTEFHMALNMADEIHAFNAQFERVIHREVLQKRGDFSPIPLEKWRCTAAKAAYYALPRSLKNACAALDLQQQKDTEGGKIMMKMTNPNKRTGKWYEDKHDFLKLLRYCIQDVEAEYDLDQALPADLPPDELKMYQLDQVINDRGVYADLEAIQNLIWKVGLKEQQLLLQVQSYTSGRITSPRQVEATKNWLIEQGVDLDNLQKETVKNALKSPDMPFAAEQVLSARQSLAKSSVAKLATMTRWACKDARIRGSLQYYGANTGRWAGRGIQPQNYPRDSFKEDDILKVLSLGVKEVDEMYECTMLAASKSLRGMLGAAPGKRLLCSDFASIEARVLAWLAGEHKKVDAFKKGQDVYVLNAANIYRIPPEQITKDQRLIGKVCELALGYQGWLGAFQAMAQVYGVRINIDRELEYEKKKRQIDTIPPDLEQSIREEKESEIIKAWRNSNNMIVQFWAGVQEAAIQAVKTGKQYEYGQIKFGMRGRFLHCRLPSGRLLAYCDPGTAVVKTKYNVEKEVVCFMGWDSFTNRWCRQYTYGGKLTENIVQATARDLLRDALFRLESFGFNTVLHVHDEILAEENPLASTKTLERFVRIMADVPTWAEGCPIDAEGWEGTRYKK